jgi:hypothetical protein
MLHCLFTIISPVLLILGVDTSTDLVIVHWFLEQVRCGNPNEHENECTYTVSPMWMCIGLECALAVHGRTTQCIN